MQPVQNVVSLSVKLFGYGRRKRSLRQLRTEIEWFLALKVQCVPPPSYQFCTWILQKVSQLTLTRGRSARPPSPS